MSGVEKGGGEGGGRYRLRGGGKEREVQAEEGVGGGKERKIQADEREGGGRTEREREGGKEREREGGKERERGMMKMMMMVIFIT